MAKTFFSLAENSGWWTEGFQRMRSHLLMIWVVTVIVMVLGMVVAGWIIVTIPADYFVQRRPISPEWQRIHPLFRTLITLLRNIVGLAVVLLGTLMALPLIPGPGLLILLLGLGLMDFPGKWRLERWLIQLPTVFTTLNRLRKRKGREPLLHPQSRQTQQLDT